MFYVVLNLLSSLSYPLVALAPSIHCEALDGLYYKQKGSLP